MIAKIEGLKGAYWVDAPGFLTGKLRVNLRASTGNLKPGEGVHIEFHDGHDFHGDGRPLYCGGCISRDDLREIIRLADEADGEAK